MMSNFDFSPYKGLYLKTAREYVDKIQQSIDTLLTQPNNQEAIMTLYISAHSLGSQSTLTNYKNMEAVCLVIEHIFQQVKNGSLKISQDLLGTLKKSIIGLTNCLNSIDKDNKEIDLADIKNQLEAIS